MENSITVSNVTASYVKALEDLDTLWLQLYSIMEIQHKGTDIDENFAYFEGDLVSLMNHIKERLHESIDDNLSTRGNFTII